MTKTDGISDSKAEAKSRANSCSSALCMVSLIGIVACAAIVIYHGITVVRPYMNYLAWEERNNGVISEATIEDDQLIACDCSLREGPGCKSVYPCLRMKIAWGSNADGSVKYESPFFLSLKDVKKDDRVRHSCI